jgi:hypothetical protein
MHGATVREMADVVSAANRGAVLARHRLLKSAAAVTAALMLGCGCSGWVDPDDQPIVSDEALRESRFLKIGVLRDAPVDTVPDGVGVRVELPDRTDPFTALVAVVHSAGRNGVAWTRAVCTAGDSIVLNGSERLAGHDNPVKLIADRDAGDFTFAIRSATANNEPGARSRQALVDGCTAKEQDYLTILIEG